MKKLISVLLTLVLVCSVCAISSSAATVDVAQDGTIQWFYSEEPYEDITTVDGYVFGYIGDADGDSSVSVLDATAIQMHIAQLSELSDDGYELSDVDLDGEVSVLDATAIQMFIAQLSDNPYITHTLYYDDYIEYTFDQIADYLIQYGDYDSESNYYYTIYFPSDLDDVEYGLILSYYPDEDCICFYSEYYQISTDTYVGTFIEIERGDPVFIFGTYMYDDDEIYYEAYGCSELVDNDEYIFNTDCQSFTSDYYSDFSEIQDVCERQFRIAMVVADELLWDYIDGYVTDIFW